MITRGIFVRLKAKPGKEEELAGFFMKGLELRTRRRRLPCGLRFVSEAEALPSSMRSQMKRDDKLISTDLLPKRLWRRPTTYLRSRRQFSSWK